MWPWWQDEVSWNDASPGWLVLRKISKDQRENVMMGIKMSHVNTTNVTSVLWNKRTTIRCNRSIFLIGKFCSGEGDTGHKTKHDLLTWPSWKFITNCCYIYLMQQHQQKFLNLTNNHLCFCLCVNRILFFCFTLITWQQLWIRKQGGSSPWLITLSFS